MLLFYLMWMFLTHTHIQYAIWQNKVSPSSAVTHQAEPSAVVTVTHS